MYASIWRPVVSQIDRHVSEDDPGPFLCLFRFRQPDEDCFRVAEDFSKKTAQDTLFPRTWIFDIPQPLRHALGASEDRSICEMLYVFDHRSFRHLTESYYSLAAQASALLPPDSASRRHLITAPSVKCNVRSRISEDDRWTWFALTRLHEVGLLRSQQLPEARAEAYWFAGDAFVSSRAVIALMGDPAGPQEGNLRRPTDRDLEFSLDYSWIRAGGVEYAFPPRQRPTVRLLVEAFQSGHPHVLDADLLNGSRYTVLRDLFKGKGGKVNPAWSTLIVQGEVKGSHRLQVPPAVGGARRSAPSGRLPKKSPSKSPSKSPR
jgi:hypothetical protein